MGERERIRTEPNTKFPNHALFTTNPADKSVQAARPCRLLRFRRLQQEAAGSRDGGLAGAVGPVPRQRGGPGPVLLSAGADDCGPGVDRVVSGPPLR